MHDGCEALLPYGLTYDNDTSTFGPTHTATSNLKTGAETIPIPNWVPGVESASGECDDVLSVFSRMVTDYIRNSARQKPKVRSLIIDELKKGERVNERVNILLTRSAKAASPGRLDDAIDVLASQDTPLGDYVSPEVLEGFNVWNEDEIYILLRAAGKRRDGKAWPLVARALDSTLASTREAAVEALCDIGTKAAKRKLQELADNDPSFSVRRLAEERLEELEEA